MKRIPLHGKWGEGKYALVDDKNFEFLNKFKWYLSQVGYPMTTIEPHQYMHRLILKVPKGKIIDHINADKLDNREQNLRICTVSQNLANVGKKRGKNKYKGVYRNESGETWMARIFYKWKPVYLGNYSTPELAAQSYNQAALKYFGEFAKLNEIKKETKISSLTQQVT